MKKSVSLILAFITVFALALLPMTACAKKKVITIYATSEDYRIENAQKMLNEKFPEYTIQIAYKSTGDLAAKLTAEGKNTDCDIIMELENAYMEKIADSLAELKDTDFSIYREDLVPASHKYVPMLTSSCSVIVNTELLAKKNLAVPTSYEDLLKPEYKGLITMPSPKSSSTAYVFLLNLVNAWGEEKAFDFFDGIAANISGAGFTSSGSGPVQNLKMGEAAIGLGMTHQAVVEINNGAPLKIIYFEQGAPYDVYSSAVIDGKQNDADIMKVFNYLQSDVIPKDKELFVPETIYKDRTFSKEGYPEDIPYGDMTGLSDIKTKERLLNLWKY